MKIIECPRDAMQGIKEFIPTDIKIKYINKLLNIGFDTLDVGSFVSPKAIPQMKDTAVVLKGIAQDTKTKLLTIVANERGAADACGFEQVTYLGYPFSISPTFQQRNTNAGIEASFKRVENIFELCQNHQKELVIYISMAFGNPYGDEWNHQIAIDWLSKISELGVRIFSMSDTVGVANPQSIDYLFSKIIPAFPLLEIGAHLHTTRTNWKPRIEAAYNAGCRRFDAAMMGFGGCPMAKDDLVGNLATEDLMTFLLEQDEVPPILNTKAFEEGLEMAKTVFPI